MKTVHLEMKCIQNYFINKSVRKVRLWLLGWRLTAEWYYICWMFKAIIIERRVCASLKISYFCTSH